MIAMLSGRVVLKAADHVILDVRGVGYAVFCSDRTLAALPGPGEACVLYTELLVREDLMQLYGFVSPVEKEWHRLLVSVQGVGAKAALSIQGALGAEGLSRAIAIGDWNAVKAAKGIGPKIAQRVVLDLKDKAPQVMAMAGAPVAAAVAAPVEGAVVEDTPPAPGPAPGDGSGGAQARGAAQADALSALTNLGYGPSEAAEAVARAQGDTPDADSAALIRAALRLLAPKERT